MSLRAVVFDYGMVLTGTPDQTAHAEMVRITGLPVDEFERLYWADRHAYDEGKLTGVTFWQKLLRDGGLALPEDAVHALNAADARMWTTESPEMVAWQARLKQRGLKTAILSNMGDAVLASILKAYAWIENFDVRVWSYQLKIAKPDPGIYRHTLAELGVEPGEALFIDDKLENVEAARALGMKAVQFSTVARLREDLKAAGFDRELPLP
ncbi:MAG: HAD family phosphatase [Acidobacteriaceae bacterium]|nr:HAD family phosphatase [Acidobacteriaceae bacterium]